MVDAACGTLDTLKHFVFSSLPSADEISKRTLSKVHWHEGKAEIVRYIKEKSSPSTAGKVKQLADITTILWCGYYMENFIRWELNPYLRPREVRSACLLVISTRGAPTTPIEFLATRNDVGLFVASILQSEPLGATGPPVIAASDTLTFNEVVVELEKVTQRKIRYEQAELGQMEMDYPGLGEQFEQIYELFNNYGFSGGNKTVGRREVSKHLRSAGCSDILILIDTCTARPFPEHNHVQRLSSRMQLGRLYRARWELGHILIKG